MVAIIGAQNVGHSLQTLATEIKMSAQYSPLFLFFISILFSSLSAQNTGPTDIAVNNPVMLTSDCVFRSNMVSKVTCSADQINLDPSIVQIQYLQLNRQLLGSRTVEEIAALSPYSLFDIVQRKNIPPGRQWTIDFSGVVSDLQSANFNTRSTKVELTMSDVRCADAGVYECVVVYRDQGGASLTGFGQQNISSRAAIENFYVSVDPQNVGFQYTAGVNVTMSCYAEGPEDIQMSWHYLEPNSPEVMRPFVDSNIHMDQPEAKPNDECGSMKHRSEFSIQLQEAQDGYIYVCAVKDGNGIELHRSHTICISAAAQNTGPTDIVVNNAVQLTSDTVFRRNMVSKVACSADQIKLDPSFVMIQSLQLKRQLLGSLTVEEIALLSPYSLFVDVQRKNIPIGRQWTIDFSGVVPISDLQSVNFNTRSTKAELTMNDVRRADAGVYECVVSYISQGGILLTSSVQQIISSRGV